MICVYILDPRSYRDRLFPQLIKNVHFAVFGVNKCFSRHAPAICVAHDGDALVDRASEVDHLNRWALAGGCLLSAFGGMGKIELVHADLQILQHRLDPFISTADVLGALLGMLFGEPARPHRQGDASCAFLVDLQVGLG